MYFATRHRYSSAGQWLGLIVGLIFTASPLAAQSDQTNVGVKGHDEPMKIQGVFNTDLPRTERKHRLRLIYHPHFGDLTQRDYLRTPLGFRYGLNDRWEASGEIETYFAHGLGAEPFGGTAGFSNLRVGTKYHWNQWLRPYFESAVGVSYSEPVGSPPAQVTDGLKHLASFITFSHRLESRPNLTLFTSLAYDDVTATRIRGERRKNQLGVDSWTTTSGLILNAGTFHYTLELSCSTSAWVTPETVTVVSIRPAILWDLPKSFLGLEGRWSLGVGVSGGRGPDGTDLGAGAKLRGEFDVRKLFRRPTRFRRSRKGSRSRKEEAGKGQV